MFRATQDPVHRTSTFIRDYHPLWSHFPVGSEDLWLNYVRPTTPTMPKQGWFGLVPVRSPLLRESLIVFFSSSYLDVSVHWVGLLKRITVLQTARLSHSEIFESKVICTSSKLIAAYHVLHRLWEPRHSPCALNFFLCALNEIFISLKSLMFASYSYIMSMNFFQ